MKRCLRRTIWAYTATMILVAASGMYDAGVSAQESGNRQQSRAHVKKPPPSRQPAPAAAGQPQKFPPRTPFTGADDAVAGIPDMPDARFDAALQAVYTQTSAADIFEVGGTGESFLDTWPLRELIAKQITPALLADIAAAHQSGRRLFIITTDLDAGRSVVWNMGAIALRGGDAALKLFRSVLLASGSVPGAFPPVLIDVEGSGKRFAELHVDGGVGGQFFVAPPALMASTSSYQI